MRVQHEGIVTHDAEAAKEFYVRLLGLQVLERPALTSKGYWLGHPGRYPQIHIIQSDLPTPGAEAAISPRVRHTCFEVADYEAMKATLRRENIAFIENEQPGGRFQLLCNDPDGNTLEFQASSAAS
jgi:catechol 2,3-dioxygenase-like lactoylglutathione lyase family enzyme